MYLFYKKHTLQTKFLRWQAFSNNFTLLVTLKLKKISIKKTTEKHAVCFQKSFAEIKLSFSVCLISTHALNFQVMKEHICKVTYKTRTNTSQTNSICSQFFLPLLDACCGPEHALSRYELGENSSSGLVSMIWWDVLLSSNGIWQLTGGGLWELGSWADGRRLDEDVGGMGRPGKEDTGIKDQQWAWWKKKENKFLFTLCFCELSSHNLISIHSIKCTQMKAAFFFLSFFFVQCPLEYYCL